MDCPLCHDSSEKARVRGKDARRYYLCDRCFLIFVDPACFVSPEAEKARYTTHNNSPEDPGYVQFLNIAIEPALPFLAPGSRGLDYGCGPGPTLSLLVRKRGFECEDYDPFFANRPPRPPYDFIFSTECFEHFHKPAEEIRKIHSLLKPIGILALMTELWTSIEAFAGWAYTRDETHVVYYHAKTFDHVCANHGFQMEWTDGRRVLILRKACLNGEEERPRKADDESPNSKKAPNR
jgi:SAM-dependent methyltransferase